MWIEPGKCQGSPGKCQGSPGKCQDSSDFLYRNARARINKKKQEKTLSRVRPRSVSARPGTEQAPKGADQGPQGGYAGAEGTTLASGEKYGLDGSRAAPGTAVPAQALERLTAWLKRRAKTGGLRPQPPNTKKGPVAPLKRLQAPDVARCVRSGLLGPILARGSALRPRGNGRNASGAGGGPPVSPYPGVALQHPAPALCGRSRHSRAWRSSASIKTVFPRPASAVRAGTGRGLAGAKALRCPAGGRG